MAGQDERPALEEELRRLVEEEALPALGDDRRAALRQFAGNLRGGTPEARAAVVNGLVERVVGREMGAGRERLPALATAVAEVIVILREWEWLDLMDAPPRGHG
ncbi:MAG TPA: hypothetical protein VEB20_05100 [Azospirillaceae bacterium]|nr:hypothetical protein [Azospirillaceae bacterium]